MNLRILNELEPNVIPYLPFGVTTLEMKIEGDNDERYGFIYPYKRANPEKKIYVGYADDSEDFLVLWGAGKIGGLNINMENVDGRLFLQILHSGKTVDSQNITLYHSQANAPISVIQLIPAEKGPNIVAMEENKGVGDIQIISFKGNRMPDYYPRWFPPRPSENKNIQYHDVEVPQITIRFKVKEDKLIANVDSDLEIFLDDLKIGQVTGDWRYSRPHAEVFTVFGDSDYVVLRLWLYWIHTNFSKDFLRGSPPNSKIETGSAIDKPTENERTNRSLWESLDIECPDNERFDFLIDMKKKKISWMGTDFHYQESWYKFEESEQFVKARIANDIDTLEQVFKRLNDRFDQQKENYDPMIHLKELLRKPEKQTTLIQENVPEIKNGTYRGVGFTRKHVPYAENGKAVAELVSSVVTS